ncbi:MAG TPA: hypothetical protein VGD08_17520 [Stellaceae bacterium]|jgi:hypothetical protein
MTPGRSAEADDIDDAATAPPQTIAELRAAAARCRRLAGTIVLPEEPARQRLLDLAAEYDARAAAAQSLAPNGQRD